MKSDVSLARRLIRAYGMQAALIALAAVLGVYLATVLLEGVLIKQALQQEATYFRDKRAEDPGFPLPNTANLTGYLVSAGTEHPPESVRDLPPGFHHLPTAEDLSVAYVTVKDGEHLVLLFNARQVGELAIYFGLVPLAAVLVLLYLSMWVAIECHSGCSHR